MERIPLLREHLTTLHGQDPEVVAAKDIQASELWHFMIHDRMRVGWSVPEGTITHSH